MTKIISLTLPEDLISDLKKIAESEGRSVSNLVTFIIRSYIEARR